MADCSIANEMVLSASWTTSVKKTKSKKTTLIQGLDPDSFTDVTPESREIMRWPESYEMVDKPPFEQLSSIVGSIEPLEKIVQGLSDQLERFESKYCPGNGIFDPSHPNVFAHLPPPPPSPPRPSSTVDGISYYLPEPLPPPPPPNFTCSHQECGVPGSVKPSWPVTSPWLYLSDNEELRSAHARVCPSTAGLLPPVAVSDLCPAGTTPLREIHQPIIVVENSSRSCSRSPMRLCRGRSRRHSSTASMDSGVSTVSTPQVQKVLRHSDLLPCFEDGESFEEDLLAVIEPYDRKVYVSYHDFTSVDFNQYLFLLQYAQPDHWYFLPSPETASAVREISSHNQIISDLVAQKIAKIMAPLHHANPQTCKFPRINTGRALRTRDDMSPGCKCEQRLEPSPVEPVACSSTRCEAKLGGSHYPCSSCVSSARLPRSEITQLVYLSVVQSFQSGAGFDPDAGRPIYKVVKTGSRQAAAAQAFFDAGASGWSTVFACAMPASVSLMVGARVQVGEDVEVPHAKTMDEVLVHESHERNWMRVLF